MTQPVQQHAGDLTAVLEGFLVDRAAFSARESITEAIQPLDRKTHGERSRPGDAGFRDQTAAEGNLADQLPRQRAPAQRARGDRGDLRGLFAIADAAVVGGGRICFDAFG